MDPLTALVVKTATTKATETLLKEVLGFQDRQTRALNSLAERLSAVEESVNMLLEGPYRTARIWLAEAAEPSEDQDYKIRRAREYLYEAYSLAPTSLTQAAIAREIALLLTVIRSADAREWWRKAVRHSLEAMNEGATNARALVGHAPAHRRATTSEIADARRTRKKIAGFTFGGPSDQERFWILAGPELAALQQGGKISDAALASLPATQAISGAHTIAALFEETKSAAEAAGLPTSELPDVTLRVDLRYRPRDDGRTPNLGGRGAAGVRIDVVPRRVLQPEPELAEVLSGSLADLPDISVARLIDAVPNIGATRRKNVYRDSGLSARRRLSSLSAEERAKLERAVRARFSKPARDDVRLRWHRLLGTSAP